MWVVEPAARRDLAAKNLREDGSYADFDISDSVDFGSTAEYWWKHKDCALAAYATLENMGYEPPKGDKNSLLKRGEIGESVEGQLAEVDPEAAMRLLDGIDLALADGSPVMMGVDYPGENSPLVRTTGSAVPHPKEPAPATGSPAYPRESHEDRAHPCSVLRIHPLLGWWGLPGRSPEGVHR